MLPKRHLKGKAAAVVAVKRKEIYMATKLYKIMAVLIVVIAAVGIIVYKNSKAQSPNKQPVPVQQTIVQENNKLPVVMYFGRFV